MAARDHVIKPYRFEPQRPVSSSNAEIEVSGEAPDEPEDPEDRLGNVNWCQCGCCQPMDKQVDCVCCHDYGVMMEFLAPVQEQQPAVSCITQHPGFTDVCLSPWVLHTAWHQYNIRRNPDVPADLHRRYRYTAYRQLVRMCWGMLGRHNRLPMPSCAVHKIKAAFPAAPGQQYKGFEWPALR